MSDAFDVVSEMLDSKSDIETSVFTDALVNIVQRGKKLTQQDDDILGPSPVK